MQQRKEDNREKVSLYIDWLVDYGRYTGLVEAADEIYVRNRIIEILQFEAYEESDGRLEEMLCEMESEESLETEIANGACLEYILGKLLEYATQAGLIEDTVTQRDLFDAKLMGALVAPPSVIRRKFELLLASSAKEATDYYYKLSQDTDYIRRYRIRKDRKWVTKTKYGEIDITINLSKPEKDPKAIAAAANVKSTNYPKCLLCVENEGFMGKGSHPARQNHRVIPVTLNGEQFYWQYSPYVYFNEHCIVFHEKHIPMKIDRKVFCKLLDFVSQYPHYFLGSNADLPIVGGSILAHEHFQGGSYTFPIERASGRKKVKFHGFEEVEAEIVEWPMSVIRISHKEKDVLVELADHILNQWRDYTDEGASIYAETNGEKHNTITPIARVRDGRFELDLVLRNNMVTKEHPLGLYHPHEELHHIKKENIGLIEVMGLAILPARLNQEMKLLVDYLLCNKDVMEEECLVKHANWVQQLRDKYGSFEVDTVQQILEMEVGLVFEKVLEQAGVFGLDEMGQKNFEKFIDQC